MPLESLAKIDLETMIKYNDVYSPTISITGVNILNLVSPCVYGWQRGNQWLYIGSSMHGLARVISKKHHVFSLYSILDTDGFYLWQFPHKTLDEIRNIEKTLILLLKPVYNKQSGPHKVRKKRTKQQVFHDKVKKELIKSLPKQKKETPLTIKMAKWG